MIRLRCSARPIVLAVLLLVAAGGPAVRAGPTHPASRPAQIPCSVDSPWPDVAPIASYNIDVILDPVSHTLIGRQVVSYHNRTAEAIPNLVWHLYLNAFRDDDTLFMRESGGASRGFGYDPGHSIVKARQAGLQAVLYKPFRLDQLLDTVETVMGVSGPVKT